MEFQIKRDKIIISLPLTTPTGKVRIKRPVKNISSEPVACRTNPIEDTDYLEWQISYDTDSLQEPSVVRSVILSKPQGIRYGCELTCLLVKSRRLRLLPQRKFQTLERLVKTPIEAGIEELEKSGEKRILQPKQSPPNMVLPVIIFASQITSEKPIHIQ